MEKYQEMVAVLYIACHYTRNLLNLCRMCVHSELIGSISDRIRQRIDLVIIFSVGNSFNLSY